MPLYAIGINHKTAPVDVREQVAFGPEKLPKALAELVAMPGVLESSILSTCNRTELYLYLESHETQPVAEWLNRFHGLNQGTVDPHLYTHDQSHMVQHILSVASGLDSLVLGEPQILGQLKDAYRLAQDSATLGPMLERLFQHSFSVAKQVRTDTAIGHSPVSVAFAAVSLGRQIFGEFEGLTALLIGAGETIELVAQHLKEVGISHIIIANRSIDRARDLANSIEGSAIGLADINKHLSDADIVIASTASPDIILHADSVKAALKKRRHQPMFLVDLAVPRDIDPAISQFNDAYLYTVDDLESVIQEGMRSREQAAEEARDIIEHQVTQFMGWLRSLDAVDTIRDYRQRSENTRDEVLAKAMGMLSKGKTPEEALQMLANTLTNKLIHAPCTNLRSAMQEGNTGTINTARQLLDLAAPTSTKTPQPK